MTHKQLAIAALRQMKGDDTIRARLAFRGLTPQEMAMKHGDSGVTRAELLASYEAHDARVDAAITWVENQPE